MKTVLKLSIFLLLFSCSGNEQENTTSEEATAEAFIAYAQDEVVPVEGLTIYSTLASALDDNQRPLNSYGYLYSAQPSFYVYNTFNGIANGGHEYQCNISTDKQKNAIVGKLYHFTVSGNSHNVWSQFDSNTLYDGTGEVPLNGASKCYLEVYLDGKLVVKNEIELLTKEQALSGKYKQYWRNVDHFTQYVADGEVGIGKEWKVRTLSYADENFLAVYPVVHEGLNRFFVLIKDTDTGKLALKEVARNKHILLRTFDAEDERALYFDHYEEGGKVFFYNRLGKYNTSVDLQSGEIDTNPSIGRVADEAGTFVSPNMSHLVKKSCEEEYIAVLVNGKEYVREKPNCEYGNRGWADWRPDSRKVFFDVPGKGICSYMTGDNTYENILHDPQARFPQYFRNGNVDFIVYCKRKQLNLATKAEGIGYFVPEFDYEHLLYLPLGHLNAKYCETQFGPNFKIYENTVVPEMEGFSITVYNTGKVIAGEYKGATILKFSMQWVYEDKGDVSLYENENRMLAFAKGDSLIFLGKHLSENNQYMKLEQGILKVKDPAFFFYKSDYLSKFKNFFVEESLELSQLSIPDKIVIKNTALRKVAERNKQLQQVYSGLDFFMKDPVYGTFYVPKEDDGTFHFFLEDGTQVVYTYDLEGKQIEGTEVYIGDYLPYLERDCSGGASVMARVVKVDSTELEALGRYDGKPISCYKDKKHKKLKAQYETYSQFFEDYSHHDGEKLSYEAFANNYPMLIWKDGLGRYVAFGNKKFMEPLACEPIVYFYPEGDEQIEVELGAQVKLMETSPKADKRWQLVAHADGTFQESESYKTYQRLFWEGKAGYLPALKQGFVVKRDEIDRFLDDKLEIQGLNAKEILEFKTAWMSELQEKAYCFIGFYDEQTINNYAPINISPQPDRLIRVLMDYESLDEPLEVVPQKLQRAKERQGFTVVEWGGIKR